MKKNTLNHHDTSDNASTFVYASPSANGGGLKRSTLINSTALPTRNFSPGFGGAVLSSSSFSPSASATAATHGTTAGITPLLPIHSDYTPWPVSTSMASASDTVESECLEHYEHNLEKYKDERDRVQKKTFTKWVNKHLTKSGRHVNDLFCDLRDGFNLIALLEALSDEILIKLVNIRPEDIVEGNGKLTLGLIWTIILNFQVSLINQRRQIQQQQLRRLTEIVHHRQVATKTTKGTSVTGAAANGANSGATANGALSTSSSAYSSYSTRKISESAYQFNDGISARDALLQWAKKVTSGYSGVSVNNFTNSWKDGRAFNAILHFYKPTAVNWEKISDKSVSNRERLRHAFDAFEKEFGISKLLDPEDVDVDNPDEKSIITYVSSLYNTLCHDEASQGNLSDLTSRLTRGIGITNEKLDHILSRIEELEMRVETTRPADYERQARDLIGDLNALETPINDFLEDVETLKSHRHPDANDFHRQVLGLHQRRNAYLDRLGASHGGTSTRDRSSVRTREFTERYESTRTNAFARVDDAIKWVRERLDNLNNMQFSETLETLEEVFERHKIDNHEIQDYRQTVDECIARQAEVSAEDSYDYCELLKTLESEYQQLRDLSAGRMLDLDSLIAFIRAAQQELVWIHDREIIEVARNWSDINQLDLPMLQNYFRQLLHEIEIREKQFNDVHNQGAALINQRHPASDVIEVYLRTMQSQWDWLLNLSKCLEGHLRDALNLKAFMEESEQVEQWMQRQIEHLEQSYNRTDFSLEEGERYLRELDDIRELNNKYHAHLMQLTDRCSQISPLWQRGERISKPIVVTAFCDYKSREITIRQGSECTLLDNNDLVQWRVRSSDGYEAEVPSVVFRVPPPDPRLTIYLRELAAQFERLRKLWDKKHRQVRYNMVLNTMKTVRGWDLNTFMAIPPEQRDEIIKALNDDAMKLLSELDPNDPLALRLKEELALTNDHFYNLLNSAQKGPESEYSNKYDDKMAELLRKLDDAWKQLNDRVGDNIATNIEELERNIHQHKNFEDALQALDVDVSNVKELFRQLPDPTPSQRANYELLSTRWEDLWDLSRMYVERLKALESVLQGLDEVTDIVRRHEITLSSFDDLPSALDKLRGVHSQLIELNMVLQQQQEYVQALNKNVALLRQHVARTRFDAPGHPDVDRLEDEVQKITVRWDNVCSQVSERLRIAEEAQQSQMIYRSQYDEEILWLDRVEETINSLRRPEDLRPEELQAQLDQLVAEYAQLQEHTATIENINKEGGKFIREAKSYDLRLSQYHDGIVNIHGPQVKSEIRREIPQQKNGAQIVTEELEALNRRFAQLSSVILERKNIVNVLIQNWKRKQQEEEERRRAEEEEKRRAFEAARRKALDEADRLRRDREAAEAARRLADEEDRRRRDLEEARRAAENAERRRRDEEERCRRAAEDAERRRREEEDRRRKQEEENERRRREEERFKEPKINTASGYQQAFPQEEFNNFDNVEEVPLVAKIAEHEDEPQMFQEETVTKIQFYEMEGILHKQTGEILTFVEAIRQGLLDLSSGGEFFDILSGSRVSLEKAAELGYISENISEILNGHHGIKHPDTHEDITLLTAIQIGLYDPDIRQLRDIKTGEILSLYDCVSRGICNTSAQHRLIKMGVLKLPPMSLEHALKNGVLNPETGEFRGKYVQDLIPLRDALANGYIQFTSQTPIIAITLSDCIEKRFIDGHSGEFIDRNTPDKFTLRDALERGKELVRDNVREVVNTDTNQRITLGEAILCHAINPRQGKFTDLKTKSVITLGEAFNNHLISKPKTLTEVVDGVQVDSGGHFIDRGNRYTMIEAINAGVLDPEVRHIVDQNCQDVISIVEALERGILTPNGKIVQEWGTDGHPSRSLDLQDAFHQGILIKRVHHTIFDVKGIKNTETNANVSFNEAIEAGIFVLPAERIVDLKTQQSYLLADAVGHQLIDPMLQEILLSPIGIINDQDVTLIRAVSKGIIDSNKGVFFDKNSKRELTPREAYEHGYINLRDSLKLSALFDVHPLLMTPIKKRDQKKRIKRPGQTSQLPAEDQVKVTLAEAMKQGLIDSRTQRFRQGNTEMSLDDALSKGLIDPLSEWIVPSRASAVGPTIEEKTQQSVTETAQQLAPKIYPDKQLEETINTVKRVKRTETSAVGGPGGVSVYRAITGGKGAIEVPASGYHILEAERKGILDLTNGTVSPPGTNKVLSLEEAFNLGILNPSSVTISDPKSGRQVNINEAFENNIIDKHGFLHHSGQKLNLQDAIDKRIAHVEAESPALVSQGSKVIQFSSGHGPVTSFRPVGQPMIEEHEQSWLFDSTNGYFTDTSTGEKITFDSAIRSGKLSATDVYIREAITGKEMTLEEAQRWGIVNLDNDYYYLDRSDNKRYSFTEAARQRRIYPSGGVPENAGDAIITTVKIQTKTEVSKKEAVPIGDSSHSGEFNIGKFVDSHLYNKSSGLFTHPEDRNKQLTLKELIVNGFLNPYSTTIVDTRNGKHVKLLDAIDDHIVDDVAGTVKDTRTGQVHDFASAIRAGLVKEDSVEHYIDERSHHHSVPPPASKVHDSAIGSHSPRLIERKLQLTPYSQEPYHSRHESTTHSSHTQPFYSRPVNGNHSQAVTHYNGSNEKLVDLGGGKNVMMTVIKGDDGLEKGQYVDPSTGMKFTIQLHGDPHVTQTTTTVKSTSQVQSVELEPHAQFVGIDQILDTRNHRIMSLNEAKRLGLAKVDQKGKQTTKSYSAFRSTIEIAVNKGVVDAHGDKISLEAAIRSGIIDIRGVKYIHPKTHEPLDLKQAANMGLLDVTLSDTLSSGEVSHPATGEKISIQRAISAGIIDPSTGKVKHPFNNEIISWVDLIKSAYNNITMNGVYDPKKGYAVPVTSALIEGLIDTRNQQYSNPITGERFSLDEANKKGLIDNSTFNAITEPFLTDFHTHKKVNILEAVNLNLIDPRNKTIQVSAEKVLPISKAIEEGIIPRNIGEHLRRVDKLTFAEAVSKGLIDVSQDTFTDLDSGKQMNISEAVRRGLIDNVEALEGNDHTNLTKVITSDCFDERSGRIRDPKTNLNLTFRDAVDRRIIDPDSLLHDTESSKTVTLREALNLGLINNDGKYIDQRTGNSMTITEAEKSGLLALIASPMQAAQAVTEAVKRRDTEGYKFKIESIGDHKSANYPQPKFREESTIVRLTPQRTEPGLSVRVRSNTSDDLRHSGRSHSLIDDPLALVDLQHEFFDKLSAKGFDLDDKIIQNQATMRDVSLREAVQNGLFDVVTNEIVNPLSKRHYNIGRALQMRIILPEAGNKLMNALGIKSEDLPQTSPVTTRTEITRKYSANVPPTSHYDTFSSDYNTPTTSSTAFERSVPGGNGDSNRLSWNRKDVFYGHCTRCANETSSLLSELRNVQREQEDFHFDFGSINATNNARSQFSKIRNNLASYASRIEENILQTERLCEEGVETLSPEQFHSLKESQQKLRCTYENILKRTDAVLDRLDLATALLIEFSTKSSLLQSWILEKASEISALRRRSGDYRRLAESRRALKVLDEEIERHAGSELIAIGELAVKINDEICNYMEELRRKEITAVRVSSQIHHQQINQTVDRIQDDYAALIRSKTELLQFLDRLKSLASQHEERLSTVTNWLADLEESMDDSQLANVSTEKRLEMLTKLQNTAMDRQYCISELNGTTHSLINSVANTDTYDSVKAEHKKIVENVEERYARIIKRVDAELSAVRAVKTQRESLQRGVMELTQWLEDANDKMLSAQPLPLDLAKLKDFKFENKTKHKELDTKMKTLEGLKRLMDQMRNNASDIVEAENLDERVEQAGRRLRRFNSCVGALDRNVDDLIDALTQIQEKNATFMNEQASLSNTIGILDIGDGEAVSAVEERLSRLVDNDWSELETLARRIIQIPGVENTKFVDDLVKNAEIGLNQLSDELSQRKEGATNTRERLIALNKEVVCVLDEMEKLRCAEVFTLPATTNIEELRRRQATILHHKDVELRQIGERVDVLSSACKELIRSGSPGVSAKDPELLMERVSTSWQDLNALVANHERRIDVALQSLGGYAEAHAALLQWLEQTEVLFVEQQAPSADYKVVRAQLQNHNFQAKLVTEKAASVQGFMSMVENLKPLNNEQKLQLQEKADEISSRYNNLVLAAENRRKNLTRTQDFTLEFSQLTQTLSKFLEEANKALQVFGKIPTDAEKLEEQVQFQMELQEQIDEMRPDFERLTDLYAELVQLVGVEDVNELDVTVRSLTSRYNEVGQRCRNCGQLLTELAKDISNFIENTNQLTDWLDSTENEIKKYGEISTLPDELVQQSEELTKLAIAVAEQSALVSQVVEESRELCTHTSGGEAIALQYRIDCLRQRYSQLATEAEAKIAALSKAIPLSEELRDGFQELTDFLNGVEEDLNNLDQVSWEEQMQIIETIVTDMEQFRTQFDDLQAMCVDLQRLSGEAKANELAKKSQEMLVRFNSVNDTATRKAEQLKSAERQSRYTFDALNFWIDWFNETRDAISNAEKPSVDMEFLRAQLKQQRVLNDEIANERVGLRNVIADASRIARNLSNTSFASPENGLIAKIEKTKKLAEETADAGLERTAALEQAFVLCRELDESYTELSEWMDETEKVLQNCDAITTGMSAKTLMQQQIHNNSMLQTVQSQRPLISKFERNIGTLSELCSEVDAANLQQIFDQVVERYNELAGAFRERGDALESTIEQSSEFADRFNVFLSNLQGALNQLRHAEAASAHPVVLQQQIADNQEIIELIKQKEDAFRTMKSNAQEVLLQARNDGPAVRDIAQNIEVLDDLWSELQSGSTARHNLLSECLRRAEEFWHDYEHCQGVLAALNVDVEAVHANGAAAAPNDNASDAWRRDRLADVEANLRDAAAVYVERMRAGGVQLCELLNDIDERMYVQQHLALFDANWTAFSQMFAHLSAQLNSTSDMLARFNESHASLNTWLNDAEERIANFAPKTPAVNEEIREELAAVNAIRHELDANALQREHLSNLGAEICAGAPTAQVSFVRSALGELTQRWNRMSVQLAERFQRLERALLDMGQFRQAYDQFVIWMEHTQAALDTMTAAARPTSLKYAEIELCKFRVLQNDIYAHQPSYEAILRAGKALIRDGDGGLATNREGDADSADGGATNASTNAAIDALAERWQRLIENAERLRVMLEAAHNAVGERSAHLDEWTLWLADVLAELKTTRPVGGLPETAAAQLDDFRVLAADVEQRRSKFEKELDRLAKHLAAESDDSSDASDKEDHGDGGDKLPQKFDDGALLKRQYAQLKRDWDNVQLKLLEREAKLIDALRQAIDLQDGVNEISDWLTDAGNALSLAPTISRIPDVLRQQMDEHARFNDEVQAKRERLKELHNNGVRIQLVCEKKDAIPMKNKLISLKHAMEKIVQRSVERARLLDNAFAEAEIFFTEYEKLTRFAEMGLQRLEAAAGASSAANNTGCRLRDQLAEHRVFRDEIQRRSSVFEAAQQRGRLLEEHALASEKKTIAEANERLREKWQALEAKSLNRQKSLDEALAQSGKFDEVMAEMTAWLDATLAALEAEDRIGGCCGDVDTVHALLDEHYANVMEPLKTRLPNLNILRERAAKMLSTARATDVEKRDDNDAELSNIRAQMAHVDAQWERLTAMANRRDESLSNALTKAVDLSEMLHEFQNFVADIETKIRRIPVPAEETPVLQELKRVEELRDVVRHQADNVEKILGLARDIQTNSHKRADLAMRELIRSVTGRWELIHQLIVDKNDKLNSRLEAIREHEKQLRLLSEFIEEKRAELAMMANSDDQGQLDRLSALVGELGMFKATLRERQTEVDEARRFMKRTSAPIVQIQAPVTTVDPPSGKQHTTLKKLSASTPTTPTKSPHAKIDAKQPSRSARQQRTEEMAEAWTTLWSETDAYEARLAARRAHLEELKRLEAFTFDEWRERYLAWNDHGKARISDLFRRIDKSGTGVVPRKLFIDGILASKFPTTELEMGKVADEFDKGDGHISAKEFMNALRYDPKKRNYKPKTETERIHEEIARETSRCTCAHRFPIQHISSDDNDNRVQYGFGFGNTMKRMVRILRSTVMVRVGGGWEALDEFLLKHDPCRAKGRLNVELLHGEEYRSSFGSTDHMASFTPRKNSASSSSQVSTPGTSGHRLGPIMKIREKTERSMPMFKKPTTPKSPSSNLFSTPFQQPRRRGSDDLILNDNTRIPRPASTAASSRSSSRQNLASLADGSPNSRPASRCGSDASGFSRISSFRGMRKGSSGDPLNPKASSPLDSQSHL